MATAATGPIDLGLLPGDERTDVTAVGDRSGKISVLSSLGSGLGSPKAINGSGVAVGNSARRISNLGVIVGSGTDDTGKERGLRWDPSGAVTMLGPVTEDSWFGGLNASGEIVGRTMINDRYTAVKWPPTAR